MGRGNELAEVAQPQAVIVEIETVPVVTSEACIEFKHVAFAL